MAEERVPVEWKRKPGRFVATFDEPIHLNPGDKVQFSAAWPYLLVDRNESAAAANADAPNS